MSDFQNNFAARFDRETAKPEFAAQQEDVFRVLEAQATPVNPNPREFREPGHYAGPAAEE